MQRLRWAAAQDAAFRIALNGREVGHGAVARCSPKRRIFVARGNLDERHPASRRARTGNSNRGGNRLRLEQVPVNKRTSQTWRPSSDVV